MPNTLSRSNTRRWGFEIENSELANYAGKLERNGFNLVHDSSLEYECQCDCSQCLHECECDNCEIRNGWDEVEHCGDSYCQGNELNSPVFFEPYPEAVTVIQEVGEGLSDHSKRDSYAGMHIHIEARDLSIAQLQAVLTLWNRFLHLEERVSGFDFFGRQPNQYCRLNSKNLKDNSDKMLQVNFQNLLNFDFYAGIVEDRWDKSRMDTSPYGQPTDTMKTTIEFRGFSPSFSAEQIWSRAKICRMVVEYAASGSAPYWVSRATTPTQFINYLMND